MSQVPPWAHNLFEQLVTADSQRIAGDDVGRRMALINFDNAIEVAMATYLRLNPENRGRRQYKRDDVAKWLKNYHEKLRFLEAELDARGLSWKVDKSSIIWAHDGRNDHYHGTAGGVPESRMIEVAREAACWVFGVLFEVDNVEFLLEQRIAGPSPVQERDDPVENEAESATEIDVEILPKSKAGQSEFTESEVEEAALDWLEMLGYETASGPSLSGESDSERDSLDQVVLEGRLRDALRRLNRALPQDALDEAFRKVTRISSPALVEANRELHRYLTEGVEVEYVKQGRGPTSDLVRLVAFDDPDANDWLAVNQLTVRQGGHTRRPDVVVYLNGLPLAVFELKNAADAQATVWDAFDQLQTYKKEIPALFTYNELLVISDGLAARLGSLTANRERFMPWRTIRGESLAPAKLTQLEVLLRGVFEKRRFLDLVRYFTVFEADGDVLTKKIAAYHQFHAVNVAVSETVRASADAVPAGEIAEPGGRYYAGPPRHEGRPGDQRVGVVWHTQGSGKSLTMVFYAGRVILHPEMRNPTLVVLTDRNDLDDQLFGTFSRCKDLLRQAPRFSRAGATSW